MNKAISSVRVALPLTQDAHQELTQAAMTAIEMVMTNELAAGENGGNDSMDWEGLDSSKNRAGMAMKMFLDSGATLHSTTRRSKLDKDIDFSRLQLGHAVVACSALEETYDNGERAGGSIDWSDIDAAIAHAVPAVGEAGLAKIRSDAREENGRPEENDDAQFPQSPKKPLARKP